MWFHNYFMAFTQTLLNWYQINQRNLPWRQTRDPYKIWLSEIILQQTRVAQGWPYYEAFVSAFPTVSHLARENEDEILKLWQGLGYYSRARNLHATAKYIKEELGGKFPETYKELIRLKGVGPYTAAAIASFAFKEIVAVVDGNVFRVLSRYFGLENDISQPKSRQVFQSLADDLIQKAAPDEFNHAIMDFGAMQCTPKKPDCSICVLQESCFAYRNGKVRELPVKLKKTKITERFFTYFIFKDKQGAVLLEQRTQKDIWQGLFQFPLLESQQEIGDSEAERFVLSFSKQIREVKALTLFPVIHKLSHQTLKVHFYEITVDETFDNGVKWDDVKTFAFPVVIWNFIHANYEN